MKKVFSILLVLILLAFSLSGCSSDKNTEETVANSENQLTIIATLFPQYDFAKELTKGTANVVLLLPPGMESHSYEPTPQDIITIQKSDVFLYTGDDMEPWVSGIVENLSDTPVVADLSTGISLQKEEDDEEHAHENEEEHTHEYNPHIWTSPVLAMKMVENIENALVKADPENADFYQKNAEEYTKKLEDLDQEFRDIVAAAKHDTVYIGSRFSLLYFMEEYGLSYTAAYDSCEEESEPSIKRVVTMIQEMKENNIKAVYYEELTEPYIARTIGEAAGAQILLFHSCHNVSRDELESGATYLSLMEQNAKNLKKGLLE
ncbi:MAG: metal ABC transporter substrate-binding protein [Lachnospiraceae bacterium]|nr:metal ABC transporter substrate-binding protein [Lachnospiraceae bacterium]